MPTECSKSEEIKELIELTKENYNEIKLIKGKDWYNNKELYEMIEKMKEQFMEFNENFHKYNGLVEKYQSILEKQKNLNEKVLVLEKEKVMLNTKKETSKETNDNWGEWIVRIIALVSTAIALAQFAGG